MNNAYTSEDGGIDTNARILLVADHPANRALMGKILSRLGFWLVHAVEDGGHALGLFRVEQYDLVLMDGDISAMDGFTMALRMRALEEGKRHTPIIATSPHAASGDREKCLKAGIDDYISKPVDATRFRRALARWVPGNTPLNTVNDYAETRELFTLSTPHGNAALDAMDHEHEEEDTTGKTACDNLH